MSNNYDNNLPAQEMTDVMPTLSNTKVIDGRCKDLFVFRRISRIEIRSLLTTSRQSTILVSLSSGRLAKSETLELKKEKKMK